MGQSVFSARPNLAVVNWRNIPDYEVLRAAVHLQHKCDRLTASRQRHPLTVEVIGHYWCGAFTTQRNPASRTLTHEERMEQFTGLLERDPELLAKLKAKTLQ